MEGSQRISLVYVQARQPWASIWGNRESGPGAEAAKYPIDNVSSDARVNSVREEPSQPRPNYFTHNRHGVGVHTQYSDLCYKHMSD